MKKRRSLTSSPRSVLASSCTQTVQASGSFHCGPPAAPLPPNQLKSGILSPSRSSPSANLRRWRIGYRRTKLNTRAGREEQAASVVLHELPPERKHARIRRFTLDATVPGVVVVGPVVVVLAFDLPSDFIDW